MHRACEGLAARHADQMTERRHQPRTSTDATAVSRKRLATSASKVMPASQSLLYGSASSPAARISCERMQLASAVRPGFEVAQRKHTTEHSIAGKPCRRVANKVLDLAEPVLLPPQHRHREPVRDFCNPTPARRARWRRARSIVSSACERRPSREQHYTAACTVAYQLTDGWLSCFAMSRSAWRRLALTGGVARPRTWRASAGRP